MESSDPGNHNKAGCERPESHIGACTTRLAPNSARSAKRSCDTHVCARDRQFTTWVTPFSGNVGSEAAVRKLPMAMHSAPIQLSTLVAGLGP